MLHDQQKHAEEKKGYVDLGLSVAFTYFLNH